MDYNHNAYIENQNRYLPIWVGNAHIKIKGRWFTSPVLFLFKIYLLD